MGWRSDVEYVYYYQFYTSGRRRFAVELLLRRQEVLPEAEGEPKLIVHDRQDSRILSAALMGGASVFVTGDRDLLQVADATDQIAIISSREFLGAAALRQFLSSLGATTRS